MVRNGAGDQIREMSPKANKETIKIDRSVYAKLIFSSLTYLMILYKKSKNAIIRKKEAFGVRKSNLPFIGKKTKIENKDVSMIDSIFTTYPLSIFLRNHYMRY